MSIETSQAEEVEPARTPRRMLVFEFSTVTALVAVAGWIDAVGFLRWHGVFVSFMSGNSTEAAVRLGSYEWRQAALPFGVILLFLIGVICGELLRGRWSPKSARSAVLGAVILLLTLCWSLFTKGQDQLAISILAVAMGAQNASFRTVGHRQVAVTYVTGTIVALGRAIAAALSGLQTWFGVLTNMTLWLGIVVGAFGGTLANASAPDLEIAIPDLVLLAAMIAGFVVERNISSPSS